MLIITHPQIHDRVVKRANNMTFTGEVLETFEPTHAAIVQWEGHENFKQVVQSFSHEGNNLTCKSEDCITLPSAFRRVAIVAADSEIVGWWFVTSSTPELVPESVYAYACDYGLPPDARWVALGLSTEWESE